MTDFGSSDLSWDPIAAERFVPFAGNVVVGRGVVAHRVRQAALLLQIIVAPAAQFAHGMLGEEIGGAAPAGQLPQRGLGAVLAEFKGVVVGRLGPGAGYAHETLGLVLPPQGVERRGRIPFLAENARDPPERSPAPGRSIIFDGAVFFEGVIFTFKWGVCFRHDNVPAKHRQPATR